MAIAAEADARKGDGEGVTAATRAMPGAVLPTYGNVQIADYVRAGYWSPRSYNMANNGTEANGGVLEFKLDGLTAAGASLARAALALYEEVLGIDFRQTTRANGWDLALSDNQISAFTTQTTVGNRIADSTVNISDEWLEDYGTAIGSYSFQTYLHEIGHALGLGHAGDYNGDATYVTRTTDPDFGENSNHYLNDSWQASMMSYFSQEDNTEVDASYAFLVSPMTADWIALEAMYGPSHAFAGNTTWGFNTNIERTLFSRLAQYADEFAFTVIDSGGTDTLDFSGYRANQRIDMRAEEVSDIGGLVGNMAIARGTVIENASGGSGHDQIVGNAGNNVVSGQGGDDHLGLDAGHDTAVGGPGADSVAGGAGNDRAFGGVGNDWLVGDAGNDAVSGAAGHDRLGGGVGADTLSGGAGNDVLVGGAGRDALAGGRGHDRFVYAANWESAAGAATRDLLTAGDGGAAFTGPGRGAGDLFDFRGLGDLAWGGAGRGAIYLRDVGARTHCYVNLDADRPPELEIEISDGATLASAYGVGDFLLA